ncbi:YdcF family protein [Candidatus Pacearchaeota archaeon]|nr:YdcF family protein [Candidatus Pacearchaeota archaeon]
MKDAVIVLSHKIDKRGRLSEEYKKRLDKGIELVVRKKAEYIILCGEKADKDVKKYVIDKGIQADKILFQTTSKDTIGEAFFTKKQILIQKNLRNIIVVSSGYHIRYRAGLIFDFILGKNFNIEYVGVRSSKLNNVKVIEDQMNSLVAFLKSWGDISAGDDEEIEKTILKNHDLYKNQDL